MIGPPGEHRTLQAAYGQVSGVFSGLPTKLFEIVHAAINVFAVAVMAIYLSLHPALYREWLIALFPPIHRDLVRDVLADLGDSLRAYIVGQLLTMTFLGAITALGLFVLDVPFWLPFGIFTGLVAIVPFFGTLLSTTLPALFVLTGIRLPRLQPVRPRAARRRAWRRRAPDRGQHRFAARDVEEGRSAAGADDHVGAGHRPVARRTRSHRRAADARRADGDCPSNPDHADLRRAGLPSHVARAAVVLRVPAPGGGVIAPLGPPLDVVSAARNRGIVGATARDPLNRRGLGILHEYRKDDGALTTPLCQS